MTPKISLITAIVGAALVFAVPAWGDNWASDKSQQATAVSPDWFERAATVAVQKHEAMLDARERALSVNSQPAIANSTMLDARERAQVEKILFEKNGVTPVDPRSDGLNRLYGLGEYAPPVVADDRFRIDHSNVPVTVAAPTSGRDIEWPTIGIGFAVGLMLILGLVLTLKATHTRPFAH